MNSLKLAIAVGITVIICVPFWLKFIRLFATDFSTRFLKHSWAKYEDIINNEKCFRITDEFANQVVLSKNDFKYELGKNTWNKWYEITNLFWFFTVVPFVLQLWPPSRRKYLHDLYQHLNK